MVLVAVHVTLDLHVGNKKIERYMYMKVAKGKSLASYVCYFLRREPSFHICLSQPT